MTAPRRMLPGSTYFLTRRCTQRQFLLRPDPTTTEIFEYCLAEAAARHGIVLIAWLAMSNHYHAVAHDPHGTLPAFLEHFHKMVARALNARWGRWENLWSNEQACATLLPTPEDVFAKVVYVLTNPINDHLVDRITDWPGSSSVGHLRGAVSEHARPDAFFSETGIMPETATLKMSVPCVVRGRESRDRWLARLEKELARRETNARATRIANGSRIVGRKAVLRASPFSSPDSNEPRRELRPERAGADRATRIAELAELVAFRIQHEAARCQFISGDHGVVFPAGTYRMRLLGACCEPFPAAA